MTATHPVIEALAGLRRRAGLTQERLAALMGTGQSEVSDIERGKVSPRLCTLARYAAAVGAEVRIVTKAGAR